MSVISDTILAQLGGSRFQAMTGAKDYVHDETSLEFSLPDHRINRVKITLDPSDTYTVEFGCARKEQWIDNYTLIDRREDVYAENLREVFERVTGLRTSL